MADPYCTLSDLKDVLGVTDFADDVAFSASLQAVSSLIDAHCRRSFQPAKAEVRTFTASSASAVSISDATSVTSVAYDLTGDGTYTFELPAGSWLLEPLNPPEGHPFTRLLLRRGVRPFPRHVAAVQVTGEFGWPAVPSQVQQACLLQTSRLFKRGKDAPFGVLIQPEMEAGIRLLSKLDVDVEVLLAPLRRHTPLVV